MQYWTMVVAVGLANLVISEPLVAQDEVTDMAEVVSHLPADSMELGAKYIEWILDIEADSLWNNFNDEMQDIFESVGHTVDQLGNLFEEIGIQERPISQRYWMRHGNPQFWHTAKFSSKGEHFVIRLVISPDGKISGIGFNPESLNPEVDDPDQHADS